MNLRILIFLVTALFIGSPANAAQPYWSQARGISINTNSVLTGPLDFFVANSNHIWRVIGITNLDSLAKATNGFQVSLVASNATLKGATVIPSGASLTGAPGAPIAFDKVTLTGIPTDSTDAVTKGVLDSSFNIVFLVVPPGIYNNLAGLVSAPVSSVVSRFAYVRNSTGGDGAAGLWIWDPTSTITEGVVVKKSSNLSPSDPGRWIKL